MLLNLFFFARSEPVSSCFVPGNCELPSGEDVPQELSEADVESLRLDCLYANPATDKPAILSAMTKTAAARQLWIRRSRPSITEVLDKYPRLEDVPLDLVCLLFKSAG